jgi:hypothetical protein
LGNSYRSGDPMPIHAQQPMTARAPQEAFNRAPERAPQPARPGYGSSFANRPGEAYGFRSGGAYANPTPAFHSPAPLTQRTFGEQAFKPEKSGGFHPFGGGEKSNFAYNEGKMPRGFGGEKMPKNFGHEKMPKAPHFSEHGHSGGGHSGGGHLFGGHHH